MTRITIIGNYSNETIYNEIVSKGIRELSRASQLFQKRLINGFPMDVSISAISLLPTDGTIDFPDSISCLRHPVKVISYRNGFVSIIKTITGLYSEFSKLDYKSSSVLMYAVNPIAMIPLLLLKNKQDLTLTTICPELPKFRRYNKSLSSLIKRFVLGYFNKKFDKYIVFSEAMIEHLPKNRAFMVLEGFAPEIATAPTLRENNIALYAGGLANDNGIKLMIEAAHTSKMIDELWICGTGECLDYVLSHTDNTVKYLGRLSNEEVLLYEKRAKVLLNVRDPNNDLTKYSFPSKIMEYLASGGIVISSNLVGIPKEYHQHLFLLNDYSVEELSQQIDRVFSMSPEDYLNFTTNAFRFINMKTAINRTQDILQFIETSD